MPIQIGDVTTEGRLIYAGTTAIEEVRAGTELVYPSHPAPSLASNIPDIELKFGQWGGSWTYDASQHFRDVEPGSTWSIGNKPAYMLIDSATGMMSITGELTDRGRYNITVTVKEPGGGIRSATSNAIQLFNYVWSTGFKFQVPQGTGTKGRRGNGGYCVVASKLELWQDGNRVTSDAVHNAGTSSPIFNNNHASFDGAMLFDSNAGTFWHTDCADATCWVDFNMPVSTKITKVDIQCRTGGSHPDRTPDEFTMFAWLNSRWVNIKDIVSHNPVYTDGSFRTFQIQ